MMCPYPTTCEFDDYRRTGEHVCARVSCPYHIHARRMIAQKIKRLEGLDERTLRQEDKLEALKKEYVDTLESG